MGHLSHITDLTLHIGCCFSLIDIDDWDMFICTLRNLLHLQEGVQILLPGFHDQGECINKVVRCFSLFRDLGSSAQSFPVIGNCINGYAICT